MRNSTNLTSRKQDQQPEQNPAYQIRFTDHKKTIDSSGLMYEVQASRIVIGQFTTEPEWLLYISVVRSQLTDVVNALIPLLRKGMISAAIPENNKIHAMILDGSLGHSEIGKVITVKVTDPDDLPAITRWLTEVTCDLTGPEVPSARKISGCVHAEFNVPSFYSALKGQTVPDQQHWPFDSDEPLKRLKRSRWISGRYLLISTLKDDAKGGVFKCLNLRSWFNIRWCVVKEGKANQCLDDFGRSVTDRLEWQFYLHNHFSGRKMLPDVLDFLKLNGNAYLVMEYIDGMPYNDRVSEIQEGIMFRNLNDHRKEALVKLALQLTSLIKAFHTEGYLHRDISPINFMVRTTGELVAIDVELAYDLNNSVPAPWFTLGTEGYMSPGQRALQVPVVADDIYGIGGILIRTFTGLSPIKFEHLESQEELCRHLNFFIDDPRLVNMLAFCRDNEPAMRPAIDSIHHNLELLHVKTLTAGKPAAVAGPFPNPDLAVLIYRSITGFKEEPVMGQHDLWYTKAKDGNLRTRVFSFYPDLYGGASGVLYTLSVLDRAGYSSEVVSAQLETNLRKIIDQATGVVEKSDTPGLLSGHAGVAVVLARLMNDGYLERTIQNLDMVAQLFAERHSRGLGLYNGMAGYGIATMKVSELLSFPAFENDLHEVVENILQQQRRQGYWFSPASQTSSKHVANGLFHGISGIAYFLLVYGLKNGHTGATQSAVKAISYLASQLTTQAGSTHIPASSVNRAPDPWLEHGFSGMAFLFIKAYEYLKDPQYKKVACTLLNNHPKDITSNYISQASGVSGVGEVYLEAFRVFKEDEWFDRASRIGLLLAHSYCCTTENGIYWLDGNDSLPTPDLMTGNAGILHFLARLHRPELIDFPIIDIRL